MYGKEVIAVDGSKFRASNSKRNNFNQKKIQRHLKYINEKINSYFNQLDSNDQDEADIHVPSIEDERYLLAAVRYIHNNPVEAGMVATPADYLWSSYNSYVSPRADLEIVNSKVVLSIFAEEESRAIVLFKEGKQLVIPKASPSEPYFRSYSPNSQYHVDFFKLIVSSYVDNRNNPNPFTLNLNITQSTQQGSELNGSVSFNGSIKAGILGQVGATVTGGVKEYRQTNEAGVFRYNSNK